MYTKFVYRYVRESEGEKCKKIGQRGERQFVVVSAAHTHRVVAVAATDGMMRREKKSKIGRTNEIFSFSHTSDRGFYFLNFEVKRIACECARLDFNNNNDNSVRP